MAIAKISFNSSSKKIRKKEKPVWSPLGTAEDMRTARHSHSLSRVATHLWAPKPKPDLIKGRKNWWTLLSSYSMCSTHVTWNTQQIKITPNCTCEYHTWQKLLYLNIHTTFFLNIYCKIIQDNCGIHSRHNPKLQVMTNHDQNIEKLTWILTIS